MTNHQDYLTTSEIKVALALKRPENGRESAKRLNIAYETFDYQRKLLYAKLGVHSREELLRYMRENPQWPGRFCARCAEANRLIEANTKRLAS